MTSAGAHSEISRMMRRTRAHRERAARRRRQAIALGAGVFLSLGLGTAFSLASFAGGNLAEAAVTRARSLMDLMDQRSPGERTAGELTKTKRKSSNILAEDAPEAPKAEVPKNLADVIAPPAAALAPVSTALPPTTLELPQPPASVLIPPPGGGIVTPPGGGGGTPPGGGGGTPPGGGGGSPPGGGGGTPPDQPPPALPEPGTWMTMILGFGLAGWSLRRNRGAQPFSQRG